MTRFDWLRCEDPLAMLHLVSGRFMAGSASEWASPMRVSDRKLRLLACACVRQVWHLLTDDAECGRCVGIGRRYPYIARAGGKPGPAEECPACEGTGRVNRSRRAVEVAEAFADGEVAFPSERLNEAFRAAEVAWQDAESGDGRGLASIAADLLADSLLDATPTVFLRLQTYPHMLPAGVQADLIREMAGDPYKPAPLLTRTVSCDRCNGKGQRTLGIDCGACEGSGETKGNAYWLTPTVLEIAREAYACRLEDGRLDAGLLGILADAIADAGYEDEYCTHCVGGVWGEYESGETIPCACRHSRLLTALRSPGPHYRGFWALDRVIGKD